MPYKPFKKPGKSSYLKSALVSAFLLSGTAAGLTCSPATAAGPGAATNAASLYPHLCWLDFSGVTQAQLTAAGGVNLTYNLPDGSTLTFNAKATLRDVPGVTYSVRPSVLPTWSGGSVLGNAANGSYTGISGNPALHVTFSGSTSTQSEQTVVLSNIGLRNPNGVTVPDFQLVVADAESTNSNERLEYTSDKGLTVLDRIISSTTGSRPKVGSLVDTVATTDSVSISGESGGPGDGYLFITGNGPGNITVRLFETANNGAMAFAIVSNRVSLQKSFGASRLSDTDQFNYYIQNSATPPSIPTAANQITAGTGRTQTTGPAYFYNFTASSITLAEKMSSGSSTLSSYSASYACATNAPALMPGVPATPLTPISGVNSFTVNARLPIFSGGYTGTLTNPVPVAQSGMTYDCTMTNNVPVLEIVKANPSSGFTQGVEATYTITVKNTGSAATSGNIVVTDTLPSLFSVGTLPGSCAASGQVVTCTITSGLAARTGTTTINIPVTPNSSSAGVSNTATVRGGGDATCAVSPLLSRCASTTTSIPVAAPLTLTVTKNISGSASPSTLSFPFKVNCLTPTASYNGAVTVAAGSSSGSTTLKLPLGSTSCTITEGPLPTLTNYSWGAISYTQPSAAAVNGTLGGTITNTLTRNQVNLTLTKTITGVAASVMTSRSDFGYSLVCDTGTATGTVSVAAGSLSGTTTVIVPAGATCSALSETSRPAAPAGYVWGKETTTPPSGAVATGAAASISNPLALMPRPVVTLQKYVRMLPSGVFGTSGTGHPGDRLQYCILFKNTGNAAAANFKVTDAFPSSTQAANPGATADAAKWNLIYSASGADLAGQNSVPASAALPSGASYSVGSVPAPAPATGTVRAVILDLGAAGLAAGGAGTVCFDAQIK